MKKKALKSNRNRHTGRINAYKQSIIDNGKGFVDSRNHGYYFRDVNFRYAVINGYKTAISSRQIVFA